jgi:hypothetical protein
VFGAHGEYVERPQDIRPALERAAASGKPAVVNVITDPQARSSTVSFAAYRVICSWSYPSHGQGRDRAIAAAADHREVRMEMVLLDDR